MVAALTVEQVFDAMAIRVNGPKAWHLQLVTDWHLTDEDRTHRVELRNGVLVHYDTTDTTATAMPPSPSPAPY